MADPAMATVFGCSSLTQFLDFGRERRLPLRGPETQALRAQVLETGTIAGFEVHTRRLDGSSLWLSVSASLVRDSEGRPIALEGTLEDITSRKQVEKRLHQTEESYRSIFEHVQTGIFQTTPSGKYLAANPALARIYGYDSPKELMATLTDIGSMLYVVPARRREFQQLLHATGHVCDFEYQVYRKDGRAIWVSKHAWAVRDESGGIRCYEGTVRDISKRKLAEDDLRQAERKYQSIFENSLDGIFQTSIDGQYLSANPALARIYGFSSPQELMDHLTDISGQLYSDPGRRQAFRDVLAQHGSVSEFESEVRRKDGSLIWISESAWEVRGQAGELLHYEGLVQDITTRKSVEDQLRHQAFHDALTGLPNRLLFMDRLEWAIHRTQRKSKYRFAVFFLDLDRFKVVNDSLGHLAGDALLVEVAARLKKALRPMDSVARFGGDEFAVLVDDITGTLDATHVLSRLREELGKPIIIQGRQVFTSASIGVVLKTWVYDRPEQVVRDADIAMYRAKALGKARYEVYDSSMHLAATSLLQLETDLRNALEFDELRLHYQPIVDIHTGDIKGFEALVRWEHPRRGLIAPAEFIPMAEETGMILPLGRWVLREACRQLAAWQTLKPTNPPLSMSVNISARQFGDIELIGEIRQILEETMIPPESLKLEITESKVMENAEFAVRMLTHLKGLGVRISIDDFGTGYSSLAYLHSFPLDCLKIDRSFVDKMGDGQDSSNIVAAIVGLAHSLGLEVVAEGVEVGGQREALQGFSCQLAQGFLFSRPVPGVEAEALLVLGSCQP